MMEVVAAVALFEYAVCSASPMAKTLLTVFGLVHKWSNMTAGQDRRDRMPQASLGRHKVPRGCLVFNLPGEGRKKPNLERSGKLGVVSPFNLLKGRHYHGLGGSHLGPDNW